jgi:glycosyltransferase involved in cell wall biosynthesis
VQLAERLATSAIYALPARYEPFGLSALEAGLSGCALVLGDIPTLREVWGAAAMFVPPDDHAALAETLDGLISNSALRADLAQRARSRAENFSPARVAAGYLEAYRSCLINRTAEMTA